MKNAGISTKKFCFFLCFHFYRYGVQLKMKQTKNSRSKSFREGMIRFYFYFTFLIIFDKVETWLDRLGCFDPTLIVELTNTVGGDIPHSFILHKDKNLKHHEDMKQYLAMAGQHS